jgi:hypothetical protein
MISRVFNQAGKDPCRLYSPANRESQLMNILDVFFAVLGGKREPVTDGLETCVEDSTCHLGYGLTGRDAVNPIVVGGNGLDWFGNECVLFAHGGLLHQPNVSCCQEQKKADVAEHPKAFDHVGLLFNEPTGRAGLFFI